MFPDIDFGAEIVLVLLLILCSIFTLAHTHLK